MAARALKVLLGALAALVVADVALQRCALDDGEIAGRRIAPFDPPLFAEYQRDRVASYARLVESGADVRTVSDFDPELGWSPRPNVVEGLYAFDERGARVGVAAVPHERTSGVLRVVALGCSFTFGLEVANAEAWPARVDAARADLEVVNLACAAYGLDQCLLRFRRDGARERPDEVWLGIFPGAALRNVTTYHPNLSHWTSVVHVKPRFEFDASGALALVPAPARSLSDLIALVGDSRTFVERVGAHDFWVQRAPSAYAPRGTSLWHSSAFARLALTWHERRQRVSEAWLADPASEVARLEDALVRTIAREATQAGARFRAFIVCGRAELEPIAAGKGPPWSALVDGWRASGLEVVDASGALVAAGAHADARCWAPDGHYSAEGNRIVADAVIEALARQP